MMHGTYNQCFLLDKKKPERRSGAFRLRRTLLYSAVCLQKRCRNAVPARSGAFRRVPARSGAFRRVPARSGAFRRVPARSGAFRRVPARSGAFRRVPARSGAFLRVPARSCAFRRVPARSGAFQRVPVRSGAFQLKKALPIIYYVVNCLINVYTSNESNARYTKIFRRIF